MVSMADIKTAHMNLREPPREIWVTGTGLVVTEGRARKYGTRALVGVYNHEVPLSQFIADVRFAWQELANDRAS